MFYQIIGPVAPPQDLITGYGVLTGPKGGLVGFIINLIRLLILVGSLWTFFNLILAGYGFLGAGDDPKKVEAAWGKIWQSVMGMIIILGSFVLGAIISWLLFGDAAKILNPIIYGP